MTGAAASYAEGVRRLLAVQDGASTAFAAAVAEDPQHARAHVALAMIATERPDRAGGPDAVTGHLARARAALAHGSDEDRSHVEAIATWCEKGNEAGTDALIDHLDRVPDDAVALLVLAPSIAFAGAGDALPDAWQYVEKFTGVHGEAPWYLGLRAYGRTEQGLWYDAADLADAALELDPGNGNAAHALTHVHYETDAHGAGLKWLTDWIPATAARSGTCPTFNGTPRCTSWRWVTRPLPRAGTTRRSRRRIRTVCAASSTPVRWHGGPACTRTGSPRPIR